MDLEQFKGVEKETWAAGLDMPMVANNDPDPRLLWLDSMLIGNFRTIWAVADIQALRCKLAASAPKLLSELAAARAEIERLKAGRFTPEELQNLCHGLSEADEKAFCDGCTDYQRKLFGRSANEAARAEAAVLRGVLSQDGFYRLTVDQFFHAGGPADPTTLGGSPFWVATTCNQAGFFKADGDTPQAALAALAAKMEGSPS